MTGNRLLLLLILLVCCASVNAQEVEFEKIMFPIALRQPVPGAYGSLWKTEVWVRNGGQNPVMIVTGCQVGGCQPYLMFPGVAERDTGVIYPPPGQPPGTFLLADRRYAGDLQVSLRIRDLSRQELTWGTELPVVRSTDLRIGKLGFLEVPLEARFRQMLRLYSMAAEPIPVTVSFFEIPWLNLSPQPALATRTLTITPTTFDVLPGYVELPDFGSTIPELIGKERVYVEIRSDSALPFWGFISVTNNETQHVTTITPR